VTFLEDLTLYKITYRREYDQDDTDDTILETTVYYCAALDLVEAAQLAEIYGLDNQIVSKVEEMSCQFFMRDNNGGKRDDTINAITSPDVSGDLRDLRTGRNVTDSGGTG